MLKQAKDYAFGGKSAEKMDFNGIMGASVKTESTKYFSLWLYKIE